MSDTTSIDAAATAVNALLAELELSNVRVVYAPDTGTADNYVLTPTPAVAIYGPDLLILADIANPNLTTTPKINASGLGQLSITAADGTAVKVGVVAGKCLFGLSSATGGSYTARLLFSTPVPSITTTTTLIATRGQRSGFLSINDPSLPLSRRLLSGTAAIWGDNAGNYAQAGTFSNIPVATNLSAPGPGGFDTGGVAINQPYHEYLIGGPTVPLAGILSLSATGPSLANCPQGYVDWFRGGAPAVTDGSGNFYRIKQVGNDVTVQSATSTNTPGGLPLANGPLGTYSTTNPIWAAIPLSNYLTSKAVRGRFSATNSYGSGSNVSAAVAPNPNYGGHYSTNFPPICLGSVAGQDMAVEWEWLLEALYIYAISSGAAFGLDLNGWTEGN